MTKQEYAKKHGLKVIPATAQDKANANCNAGKTANYIIVTSNGRAFWSDNGTMKDLRCANEAVRSDAARTLRRRPINDKQPTAKKPAQKPVKKPVQKPASTAKKTPVTTSKKAISAAKSKPVKASKKKAARR